MKKREIVIGLSIFTVILLNGCAKKTEQFKPQTHNVVQSSYHIVNKKQKFKRVTYGKASWYGKNFDGKKTASGELFNSHKRTAAHRTLPFNTMVKVTDMVSHKSDIVRINDRGPFANNRIIDLSYASAKKIGLVKRGIGDVKIEIVGSNGKVDRRLLSLPTSNKACVGDSCRAKISKTTKSTSSTIKPFPMWTKSKIGSRNNRYTPPVIESVYNKNSSNNSYSISAVDKDPYLSPKQVDRFPKIDTYAHNVSIQVGAFRKHSGAEIYMRRYSMLSSQYVAVIKTGQKDAKPIFRVQIEGFRDESEARKFIAKYKYTLTGAFLVKA